jgi:hypothetical protein
LPSAEELVDPNDIGVTINMAGFGENNTPDGPGTKLQIDLPIDDLNSQTLEVQQAGGGICFGDSGGPDFIDRSGTIYVAGIHSFGINIVPDCSGVNSIGVSMQASEFEAFIAAF